VSHAQQFDENQLFEVVKTAWQLVNLKRKYHLGCECEPFVAAWEAKAVTSRIVVIYNQGKFSSTELIVSWHLCKASHTWLDQILQSQGDLQLRHESFLRHNQ